MYTREDFLRHQKYQLFLVVMTILMLTTNVVADVEAAGQCDESDIKISNSLQVKSVFLFNNLLALSFGIPASVNGSPFQRVELTIVGDNEKMQFSTPLSTYETGGELEAVLSVSPSRYEEYSLYAHYYGAKGCPTLAVLDLRGNKKITEYLACIRKNGWAKCNLPESALKDTTHK
jgi:hypothetical protein